MFSGVLIGLLPSPKGYHSGEDVVRRPAARGAGEEASASPWVPGLRDRVHPTRRPAAAASSGCSQCFPYHHPTASLPPCFGGISGVTELSSLGCRALRSERGGAGGAGPQPPTRSLCSGTHRKGLDQAV